MILSGESLKERIADGRIKIEPISEHSIQPASIDCRLGETFLLIDEHKMTSISLKEKSFYREIKSKQITISPHSFLLATTQEHITLPNNITAFVEGRSSIGRIGLFIQNAGWVDPGFSGRITLELYNANSLPIDLESGRRICQLVFCQMDRATNTPYRGKYQHQTSTKGSAIELDSDYSNK